MSYIMRSARVAYSNIAIASAAGPENPAVASPRTTEDHGGGSNTLVASSQPTTDTDNSANRLIGASGTGKTTLDPREYPVNQN